MLDRARRPYSGDPEADAFIAQDPLALHRFPGAMASRVRELCAAIVRDHAGDAARPWPSADAATVRRGLLELPGIPEMLDRERYLLSYEILLLKHMLATQDDLAAMSGGASGYVFSN